MSHDTITIGLDLGAFKTAVVSANGRREMVQSVVGWPKDHVGRTMLGKEILFGREVIQNRLSLNAIRPFEKGALKYNNDETLKLAGEHSEQRKRAAKLLVEYAVELTRPPKGATINGVIGVPSAAGLASKQFLIETAEQVLESVVVVSEPFAVAFGMNSLNNTLVIDVGAGTSDICPIVGRYPSDEDQVTVPIGGDRIDEEFLQRVRDNYPNANVTLNMAREIKERFGFVGDTGERIIVTLPTDGRPIDFDLTEPLKSACRSIVPPLVQGLRDVVARLDPEFRQSILNNIILSGGCSQLKGLDRVIEDTLREQGGGRVRKAYDAMFAAATGAHKLALGMPADDWKKIRRPNRAVKVAPQPTKAATDPVVVKFATMAQVVADQPAKKAA